MIIDNLNNLTFSVLENGELITITLTDPSGPTVVGTLRIAKTNIDAFLEALRVVGRETHSAFETNRKATTRFDNKTSGALEFRDA